MSEKLVRNEYLGLPPLPSTEFRIADQSELPDLHIDKIDEETKELIQAFFNGDQERTAGEAGDLIQVILSLAGLIGVTEEEIEQTRKAKRARLGGFEQGVVLISHETKS
jgi:predicted house-cleaning noncanonical NTP pyrophosphatase (MazG superfamily)